MKIVYSSVFADLLIMKGEKLSHIRQDLKNPEKNIFIFFNSPTYEKNFTEVLATLRNK